MNEPKIEFSEQEVQELLNTIRDITEGVLRLKADIAILADERDRYKAAIDQCLSYANNADNGWGRGEEAMGILERAISEIENE
jgi:hypothetical protein